MQIFLKVVLELLLDILEMLLEVLDLPPSCCTVPNSISLAGIIIDGQYWAIMTHFKAINELVRTIFELIRMGPR